jgi:hypothetical protein
LLSGKLDFDDKLCVTFTWQHAERMTGYINLVTRIQHAFL